MNIGEDDAKKTYFVSENATNTWKTCHHYLCSFFKRFSIFRLGIKVCNIWKDKRNNEKMVMMLLFSSFLLDFFLFFSRWLWIFVYVDNCGVNIYRFPFYYFILVLSVFCSFFLVGRKFTNFATNTLQELDKKQPGVFIKFHFSIFYCFQFNLFVFFYIYWMNFIVLRVGNLDSVAF